MKLIPAILTAAVVAIISTASLSCAETTLVGGNNDGISANAVIMRDGMQFNTSEHSTRVNQMLWNELGSEDRRKLMKIYWNANVRKPAFGDAGNNEMADWINKEQGWTGVVDELKRRRMNKDYPELSKFYTTMPPWNSMTSAECPEEVTSSPQFKEMLRLMDETQYDYELGRELYKRLTSVKWEQVGVGTKAISKELIKMIMDNFGGGFKSVRVRPNSDFAKKIKDAFEKFTKKAWESQQAAQKDDNPVKIISDLEDTLDGIETDANTGMSIINANISRINGMVTAMDSLCKSETEKNKQEREKRDSDTKDKGKSGETTVVITIPPISPVDPSRARDKTPEELEAEREELIKQEVNQKALELNGQWQNLMDEYSDAVGKVMNIPEGSPIPAWPDGCSDRSATPNSECFSMRYSVAEIKEWVAKFPKYIADNQQASKALGDAAGEGKKTVEEYLPRFKAVQEKMNGLARGYSKYFSYNPPPVRDNVDFVFEDMNNFILKCEDQSKDLDSDEEFAQICYTVAQQGLTDRIERETTMIRPYDSLKTNFQNSMGQIVDAVNKLDKLHSSDWFIRNHPKSRTYRINDARVKAVKDELKSLTPEKREVRLEALRVELTELQKEETHQITRLTIGQNNAEDDYDKLQDFLDVYCEMLNYTVPAFAKIKVDVRDVTGVELKDTYFDIVLEDGTSNDLWMVGSNMSNRRWLLNPSTLATNIEGILDQLRGTTNVYYQIYELRRDVDRQVGGWASLPYQELINKSNEANAKAYALYSAAFNAGDADNGSPIHKEYIAILSKTMALTTSKLRVKRVAEATKSLGELAGRADVALASGEFWQYAGYIDTIARETAQGTEAYYVKDDPEVAKLFDRLNKLIEDMKMGILVGESRDQQAKTQEKQRVIAEMYDNFKSAYESRNSSRVMSFIGDDWQAGDGTTLSDLEKNLSNSFGMFDEVNFGISGMNFQPTPDGKFVVNYELLIKSRNYENNLTHEEKSSVSEMVNFGEDGRPKIIKTLNGRFWYVE